MGARGEGGKAAVTCERRPDYPPRSRSSTPFTANEPEAMIAILQTYVLDLGGTEWLEGLEGD